MIGRFSIPLFCMVKNTRRMVLILNFDLNFKFKKNIYFNEMFIHKYNSRNKYFTLAVI